MDTKIFYIPKYCIGPNCQIIIHIPKETEFKDIAEEINKIEGFPHKLDKLIYVKVLDSQFKKIMELNEKKVIKQNLYLHLMI